jgi:hypothetical protein
VPGDSAALSYQSSARRSIASSTLFKATGAHHVFAEPLTFPTFSVSKLTM